MRYVFLSSLVVSSLLACQGSTVAPQLSPEAGPATPTDSADREVDRTIRDRVEAIGAIEKNDHDLTWSTQKGVVTLHGTLPSILAKQRLHDMCLHLPGVSGVVDQDVIAPQPNPSPQNDLEIQRSLMDHLHARNDDEVQVSAVGGNVTLTGTVPTDVEKSEIERIATRTPNVIGLTDQIHERPLSKP